MSRIRVAVLISGRGSNMATLIRAATDPAYPAEIVLVLSNVAEAPGLGIARAADIETATITPRGFSSREDFERTVDAELRRHDVELVCLAGFMRLLSPWFCERWAGRLINIHPSLLPEFRGLDTHARALAAGVGRHGCSVHFVVPEVDAGEVILQAAVPVVDGDTPETLAARVLDAEHDLYPKALSIVASDLRTRAEA